MQTTIANQLYHALSRLGRLMHRMAHRMAHAEMRGRPGMYGGQAHLLSIISLKNGASQRDLAEEADVRPSSMTEALLKMEAAGLITRRQDENDQRIMRIFLTETGEKALLRADTASLDLAARLFDGLTQEEQARMLSLVEKLSTGWEEMDQSDPLRGHGHGFRHGRHGADDSAGPHGPHGSHGPHGPHGIGGRHGAGGPHGPHRGRSRNSQHPLDPLHPGREDD